MLFDTGRSQRQGGSWRRPVKLAEFFRRHPDRRAAIEGHTDHPGGASSNQDLPDRRAHRVTTAPTDLGVGADRLSARRQGLLRRLRHARVAADGSSRGRATERDTGASAGAHHRAML